jgi:4-hydroxythreonine-4-phosphate dehydrogenase
VAAPTIAISMGDPAGIGPEVALRACSRRDLRRRLKPILVGDRGVFRDTARRLRLPLDLEVIEVSTLSTSERRPGKPTRAGAEAAYRAILAAVDAARSGRADAMTTAPVSKSAIQSLGVDFPGHTEVIARIADDASVRMMMAGKTLRVVLVTTHLRLLDVPARLTVEGVVETARIAHDALRRHFGLRHPRLALAGLNPHAGENGAFGDEETRILEPAVEAARAAGVRLDGPFPPDTLFFRAREGDFDAVVALYHDQGLIPFKLLHFHDGVNVTLGLPFPRTSPDHGTAFDIAGKGKADPSSMAAALGLAATMARPRRRA